MATTRKTAKYYRDILTTSTNVTTLKTAIAEVVKKYGHDNKVHLEGEFNWNHRLNGFYVNSKGEVSVIVYWQGDSTDGDDYAPFVKMWNDTAYNREHIIRAVHYFDGNRTYCKHGDLCTERYQLVELCKLLAEYITPTAIKERKKREMIGKVQTKVSRKLYTEYHNRFFVRFANNEKYYNGVDAVNTLIEKKGVELFELDDDTLFDIVEKVFKANYKYDSAFGADKKAEYCLAY